MSQVFDALRRLTGDDAGAAQLPLPESVEPIRRSDHRAPLKWESALKVLNEEAPRPAITEMPRPHPVGTPLQIGRFIPNALTVQSPAEVEGQAPHGAVPSVQQAVITLCAAIPPFVERLLPLLEGRDGNAGTGVATQNQNIPSLELLPIQSDMVELRTQHGHLCDKVEEQSDAIRRAEDRLGMLCEATDRNTLEQKELMEDLRDMGNKVNKVAVFAVVLLAVSIALEVILFLHMPGR